MELKEVVTGTKGKEKVSFTPLNLIPQASQETGDHMHNGKKTWANEHVETSAYETLTPSIVPFSIAPRII